MIFISDRKQCNNLPDMDRYECVRENMRQFLLSKTENGGINDKYGFSALLGGFSTKETFSEVMMSGNWWVNSDTHDDPIRNYIFSIPRESNKVEIVTRFNTDFYNIRCVKVLQ